MSTENQREQANNKEPAMLQSKTIEACIVPVEIMEAVKSLLRKLPVEDVEVVLMTLRTIKAQPIVMSQGPAPH
jgi:hypothetical protein